MTANLLNTYRRLSSPSAKKILLVEDNDVNRMLLNDYLTHLGYEIESLSAGRNFFKTIMKFQPHLILLDLKLPDIDGYSLLESIKQQPNFSCIPIIVVSAFAFKSDREHAMNLGASQYLVKPINLIDLTAAIEKELTKVHPC
ncbi:MAG: response regulator [Calothrix sp. MO_167.B12]|nr:response regulator [Calothrix sp. MO_167.B12]